MFASHRYTPGVSLACCDVKANLSGTPGQGTERRALRERDPPVPPRHPHELVDVLPPAFPHPLRSRGQRHEQRRKQRCGERGVS